MGATKILLGLRVLKGVPKTRMVLSAMAMENVYQKNNKAICQCNPGHSGKDCDRRVCATANSIFDSKTSRCTCEPGYTCCSRKKQEKTEEVTDDLSEFHV